MVSAGCAAGFPVMSDLPDTRPPTPLKTLWAAWVGITLVGPLLSIGALALMGSMGLDIDFVWKGILMATLAGIIYFSVRISAWSSRLNALIAAALSVGGAFISAVIFIGCCAAGFL